MLRIEERLEVVALSATEWRVCDSRLHENDARRLRGYLQAQGERVELMRMQPVPGLCDWFSCLEDALAAIEEELPTEAGGRGGRGGGRAVGHGGGRG
ncbi:hypothetical protein ACMA46_00785 [Clavibacter sp. Sh2141]|uniref:hypothetical protein n=1 Tax=Clavibacter sp. Sh2141 TaxID=3395374 RepID=UPI0039BD7AA4